MSTMIIMNPDERDFVSDEPLFWSNEDGWVSIDTDTIVKMTPAKAKFFTLPTIGSPNARWILLKRAKSIVKCFRDGATECGEVDLAQECAETSY